MHFKTLCDFCDTVKSTKGHTQKMAIVRSFMNILRTEGQEEAYMVLRLLVSGLDRDRPAYRIKESKISKLIIKMLGLPKGSDQDVLQKAHLADGGEFGAVIYSIIKKYMESQKTKLTVQELNQYLDRIAGRTNDQGLDDLVLEILKRLSPNDIKWFIQVMLKDLKLGVSDNTILNCFHPDGASYYAMNNNLKRVSEVLFNPQVKLHELEINIFEPFRPMLSKRCDASNFRKCFPEGRAFYIENKFDGERFQLHMNEDRFMYFSRNGFDYTDHFGGSYSEGILTPLLKDVFDPVVTKMILDGEMMLWNKNTQNYGSKGMTLDVKKLRSGKYQPCFCVFDIIMLNDEILTNQPFRKRMQLLKKVIKNPIAGTIARSEAKEVHSQQEIVDALNKSVDNNEEGIVVKDPESVYKYSDRNSGWFKVKMEYFDDVVHDLDVLIMGASYGSYNKLNSFTVGISSGLNHFLSFGRISSGLNAEQLDLLNERFKSHGLDYNKNFAEKTEGKLKFGRDTPHVYIEPHNSLILHIRATELIKCNDDSVKTPYTLRFPRILGIREDKLANECLSMNELLELTRQNKPVIKLNKRHIELIEIAAKKTHQKAKLDVIALGDSGLLGDPANILNDKKIFVQSGSDKWPKEDIYNVVKKTGGRMAFRLDPDVDIVLASKLDKTLLDLMKKPHQFDIVHVSWLRRVLDGRKLLNYNQQEIFSVGQNFRADLSQDLDAYGDSYVEEATVETLKRVFDLMSKTNVRLNANARYLLGKEPKTFENKKAYFDRFSVVNDPKSEKLYSSVVDEMHFKYYKGHVIENLTSDVNLVIMSKEDEARKTILTEYLEGLGKGLKNRTAIVSRNYLYS